MALRDQPYLPLYVQDFLTDERLLECSAEATGVYIRLMCYLHKSEIYGKILLKQKYKQTDKQIKNFALQLAKNFPYDFALIEKSFIELLQENIIQIEGDFLIQKRMVKDGTISEIRSKVGKEGGKRTQDNNKNFAKAKIQANPEIEIENINEDDNDNLKRVREKLCGHFKISESNHFTQFKLSTEFLQTIQANGDIDYFEKQLDSYIAYSKGGEVKYKILFSNFIGDQRLCFADGKWKKSVWPEIETPKPFSEIGKNQTDKYRNANY